MKEKPNDVLDIHLFMSVLSNTELMVRFFNQKNNST